MAAPRALSGGTGRHGLVGGRESLGVGWEVSKAQAGPAALWSCCLCIQPYNSQVLLQHHVSACRIHVLHHDNNQLNLWNCMPASTKLISFNWVATVMACRHSNRTMTKKVMHLPHHCLRNFPSFSTGCYKQQSNGADSSPLPRNNSASLVCSVYRNHLNPPHYFSIFSLHWENWSCFEHVWVFA